VKGALAVENVTERKKSLLPIRPGFGETRLQLNSTMNHAPEFAPVYQFLGHLWLRELDEATYAQWQTVLPTIPGVESTATVSEDLETLHIEYCRLFIGPQDHLPPYQSVWQTGQLGGPACISMERYLKTSGYEHHNPGHDTPPDHLGLQLQFYSWLLQQSATDETEASEVLQEFQSAHLTWPVEFLSRVTVAAEASFYQQLASTTLQLLSAAAD
jgi:TorA maturation chaperone TorD